MPDILPDVSWVPCTDPDYLRFTVVMEAIDRQVLEALDLRGATSGMLFRLGMEAVLRHPEWAQAWRRHLAELRKAAGAGDDGLSIESSKIDAVVNALPISVETLRPEGLHGGVDGPRDAAHREQR